MKLKTSLTAGAILAVPIVLFSILYTGETDAEPTANSAPLIATKVVTRNVYDEDAPSVKIGELTFIIQKITGPVLTDPATIRITDDVSFEVTNPSYMTDFSALPVFEAIAIFGAEDEEDSALESDPFVIGELRVNEVDNQDDLNDIGFSLPQDFDFPIPDPIPPATQSFCFKGVLEGGTWGAFFDDPVNVNWPSLYVEYFNANPATSGKSAVIGVVGEEVL